MSTTKKGDRFEAQIYQLFIDLIGKGKYFASPANCKIYQKKGYYSKDREKKIIFDISIEIYLPGQVTYSILVLVECKNYNHPIPVDDIEEFFQKTQQISGGNVKGIIAATNSFQEGALNFSKSKGLGLLRYFENNNFNWVLTRSPSTLINLKSEKQEWYNSYSAITQEHFISSYLDSYFYIEGRYTNSLNSFLSDLLIIGTTENQQKVLKKLFPKDESKFDRVAFMKKEIIELLAENALRCIEYNSGAVNTEKICDYLKSKNNLLLHLRNQQEAGSSEILGKITFNPLEITIYSNEFNIAERQRFTLAHELGHYYLKHAKYMSSEICFGKDIDLENQPAVCVNDIFRMEWQANFFASCLLLPKTKFIEDFGSLVSKLGLVNRGHGYLYLDDQKCNQSNYYFVSESLKNKYKVSRTAIKLRLIKLGLLKVSSSNHIKYGIKSAVDTLRCE